LYIHEFDVYTKKYKVEKTWVEDENFDFEHDWVLNLITYDTLVAFPMHLIEVHEMAKWVSNVIYTYQLSRWKF
jgi:hypothetical protein